MRKKINLGRVHPLVVDVKELGSRLRGHDDIIQIEGINDGRILILILSFLFSLSLWVLVRVWLVPLQL